jgi:Na+/proline symporter
MGVHPYDIAVIVAYLFVLFVIGALSARLVKTQKDMFLGGRRFGKFLLAFQSFGIGTHSEQVVAVVGECYRLGLAGIWWQFLWLFPTPVYWLSHPLLRRMRMVTSADYWSERYSPSLGKVSAVLGVFQVTFTIATMLKAMGTVLDAVTQGALPETIVIPVCAVLFVFYGIAGGLYAATITDLIQGVLTILLSLLLVPFILMKTNGMTGLHQILDPSRFSYTIPGEMTVFYIVMLSLNAIVGIYTGPHTMTNLGSGRNEWDVRVGVMSGTLMKRFCTVAWAFLGLGALAIFPGLTNSEHAFGHLVRDLLPPGLTGLMVAAILAAVMSTCDALMLSGAALVTRNLYASARPDRSEQHYLNIGRLASCAIVAVAALLAFALPSVLSGLKQVWTLYAFMGLAWWAGVIWKRSTTAAAWVSTIVTSAVYLLTLLYNSQSPDKLAYAEQIALYLGCGLVALVVTSYLTSQTDPERVRRFYRKMRTPTTQASEFDAED